MEKQNGQEREPIADPDYRAISRNPKAEWNERMWTPDEGYEQRTRVQRPDEDIRGDIESGLDQFGLAAAARPTVIVKHGSVIISGEVSSEEELQRLHEVVDAVAGVQHIFDDLRVVN